MDTKLMNNDTEKKEQFKTFDNILNLVGNDGPFQARFIWIFNFTYIVVLSLLNFNVIMALSIPKHWCYVPGRENTNHTLEEWWELTIPTDIDSHGQNVFSKCKHYTEDRNSTMPCQNGWEYDKRWYESTIVTDNDWVCEKEIYVTHAFLISRIGALGGTLMAGALGDILGRRFIVVSTLLILVVGRFLILIISSNHILFMIVSTLNSMTIGTGFMSTFTLSVEFTDVKLREVALSAQYYAWPLGVCILSLIMWIVRRWDYVMFITTIPGILIFIFYRYLIESPRWLISRGKIRKAHIQLKRIADINKKQLPDDFLDNLHVFNDKSSESKYGLRSLVSSWRLLKNVILLTICRCASLLGLLVLLYNFNSLKGNPYLVFVLLALAELPVNIFGKVFCKHFGRRLLQLFAFMCSALTCIAVIYCYQYDAPVLTLSVVLVLKFFTALSLFMINLQGMEIFPTCARQAGSSVGQFVANVFSCFGPYISFLGSKHDIRYPYIILFILMLIGALCGTFLPETLNEPLLENVEDAREFGKNQSYWNFFNQKQKKETETKDNLIKK